MDKRRFHRVGHDARATLTSHGKAWACVVEDLSLKGCMVRLAEEWPVDAAQHYGLSIHLTYSIHIDMEVVLAHQEGVQVGFRCISIDADSATKLRRLVELNLGDSALLERDLHELVLGGA